MSAGRSAAVFAAVTPIELTNVCCQVCGNHDRLYEVEGVDGLFCEDCALNELEES